MAHVGRIHRFVRYCSKVAESESIPNAPQESRLKRLGGYLKFIADDYKHVFQEIFQDMKAHPIKATFYISGLAGLGYLWKTNPSEITFKEELVKNSNQLMLIGDPIRNPYAETHMRKLWDYYNRKIIRRFNFGVCSVMWVDNYDKRADVYTARAKPLKVGWLDMHTRVVDIGVVGKWWAIEDAMKDWDINPTEWGEKEERELTPGMKNVD